MQRTLASFVFIFSLFMAHLANAAIEERSFEDPILKERYQDLIEELRCLVCQNQNLADSDADLARDLRDKTAEMLIAGKTDKEILSYMSERFGDFVLYRPPFRADTALLWLGPPLLLLIVIVLLIMHLVARQREEIVAAATVDTDEQSKRLKARELINKTPPLDD